MSNPLLQGDRGTRAVRTLPETYEVFWGIKNTGLTIRKRGKNWLLYTSMEIPVDKAATVREVLLNYENQVQA